MKIKLSVFVFISMSTINIVSNAGNNRSNEQLARLIEAVNEHLHFSRVKVDESFEKIKTLMFLQASLRDAQGDAQAKQNVNSIKRLLMSNSEIISRVLQASKPLKVEELQNDISVKTFLNNLTRFIGSVKERIIPVVEWVSAEEARFGLQVLTLHGGIASIPN